ncbi:MAG TPA: DedA family protein [Candidatus Nitrosotalea sp.]|nr:DedA family protein [Candidatus Nitrosotalea sp.]
MMLDAFLPALVAPPGASIPGWLLDPRWLSPTGHILGHLLHRHEAVGLFAIILAEEIGVPLPAPGDAAIAYAGYLTTKGSLSLLSAYLAVVAGALVGSFCLFSLSQRYGHPFLHRFGVYMGLRPKRLHRVEIAFQRWGFWAIILGREVPGLRVVLSALAGIFDVPRRIFIPSVMVSGVIWASIFLELGRLLGAQSHALLHLLPIHLLPQALAAVAIVIALAFAFEHGWRPWGGWRRRAG